MHSIINLKIWKKCIKRFSKKKLKHGDSCCSKSGQAENCIPIPNSSKKSSFEQVSLYSTDSLEEKSFIFRKYWSEKSYNQRLTKSKSLESIINSITSEISEDSLQRESLSNDSLCMPIKKHIININDYTERLKIKTDFLYKGLISKLQIRYQSQSVGHWYQQENLFNRSDRIFFTDIEMPPSYKTQLLLQHKAISVDSLDNLLTIRLSTLKKQHISDNCLNKEKIEFFDKFSISYRKKSISDGLLNETRYFRQLFNYRDFVILNRILSNEIKKKYYREKILLKPNHDQTSWISLSELQCMENYESEDDKLSIDSLYIPKSEFVRNITYGPPESCSKINKSIYQNKFFDKHNTTENDESKYENMSIDSLSDPEYELLRKSLKRNKPVSSNKYLTTENSEELHCSSRTKIHQYDEKMLETNPFCQYSTHSKKYNLNSKDLNESNCSNSCCYNSTYFRDTGTEDSISIDSLCDSLN